jgi:hypothetical protein
MPHTFRVTPATGQPFVVVAESGAAYRHAIEQRGLRVADIRRCQEVKETK